MKKDSNIIEIEAPKGCKWLSQFMDKLPVNCLFDKGITGCGGTELALRNGKNTIIAVPYVALVDNKTSQDQHKDRVLGVHGSISKDTIESYINDYEVKKIMVVYDSLPRVVDILTKMGIDVFNDFFLLVDEWHILFNSYAFRSEAIKNLLKLAPMFKEVTYMTATPIEQEYLFKEFKALPITKVKWNDIEKINITLIQANSVTNSVCKFVDKAIDNRMFGNLHIFVNSVKFISNVIKKTGLTPEQVKIVCSKNETFGKASNQDKLGYEHRIGSPSDAPKKINFYTSTCFEGCDIYDEQGLTYIVSDGNNPYTLIDISTLLIQICGRIRNAENKNITHIFSKTRYLGNTSFEEFLLKISEDSNRAKRLIDNLNSCNKEDRLMVLNGFKKNYCADIYVSIEEDKLYLDQNLVNLDIVNFKIATGVYCNRIAYIKELEKNNINAVSSKYEYNTASDKLCENPNAKVQFKDVFEEYANLKKQDRGIVTNYRMICIKNERPLVVEAFDTLGEERVKELKYHVGNIRAELIKKSCLAKGKQIKEMLSLKITPFKRYRTAYIIDVVKEVFKELEVKRVAKASELKRYFTVKGSVVKEDGKSVRTMEILSDRIIQKMDSNLSPTLA